MPTAQVIEVIGEVFNLTDAFYQGEHQAHVDKSDEHSGSSTKQHRTRCRRRGRGSCACRPGLKSAQAASPAAAILAKRHGLLALGGRSAFLDLDRNDLAHRSFEPCNLLRNEHLESPSLRRAGTARRRYRLILVACLFSPVGGGITGTGAACFFAKPCLVISPHPFFFLMRSRYPLIALHTTKGW